MGEFAHGIHVYTNERDNLINKINEILTQKGFEPTDSDECDRCIAVACVGAWISIFDEDILNSEFEKLLSMNISEPCVVLDLMDGDCFTAVLMKNGRKINTYISHPEEYDLSREKSNAGNAKRWSAVTIDTMNLQELFDDTKDNANNKLYRIAEILKIDTELASTRFSHLENIENIDIIYLKFNDKNKPPIPDVPVLNWVSLQPHFQIQRHIEPECDYTLKTGDTFTVDIEIINVGAKTEGLTINILGPNIENENIVFDSLQVFDTPIVLGKPKPIYESVFERVDYQDGRKGSNTEIEKIELPNSISFTELGKKKNEKFAEALKTSYFGFHLLLFGRAVKPIKKPTDIQIAIHPVKNYFDGYTSVYMEFKVIE